MVYRARDAKLGRDVAIKMLPEDVAVDPERLARFEREARMLAALNHPNIATVYGFEQAEATHFLSMEVVEGATLADRIERGPIPLEQALPLFIQIAEGLEAAHAKGIIHRDLKPANIKIEAGCGSGTRPGAVKILDFGLAKALAPSEGAVLAAASHSPTLTLQATMRGELLGTAAYMSPEQAEGEPADERADIWAFGVCLLEALTGRRVFSGANASRVLASVLKDEPDFAALPPSTPQAVRRLLRRCLVKDRDQRLHDIADARLELEETIAPPAQEREPSFSGIRRRSRWLLAAAALAFVLLGGIGGSLVTARLRPAPRPVPVVRSVVSEPGELVGGNRGWELAITSDGSTLAYIVGQRGTLRLRRLDRLESAPAGVETAGGSPFFSPDDRWVGYYDYTSGALRKVPIAGGPSVLVCKALPGGASWGADDTIVFGQQRGPLRRVAAVGGEARDVTPLADGEVGHIWPEFLPDGRAVLFVANTGNLATTAIHVVSLETGKRKLLVEGGSQPRYASSGHLIYGVGSTLYAVPFDARRLEIVGERVAVLEEVATSALGATKYAVSASGALAYITGGLSRNTLVWVDRDGREESIAAPPRTYVYPRLSPDGTQVAVYVMEGEADLWVWSLERGTMTRLTSAPGIDSSAVWSPDGASLFYMSVGMDRSDIFRRRVDGTGEPVRLTDQPKVLVPTSVTTAGDRLLAVEGTTLNDASDLVLIDTAGGAEPERLLHGDFRSGYPDLSRDGRLLAYGSAESGATEVYVRPFPALDSNRWLVSTSGGDPTAVVARWQGALLSRSNRATDGRDCREPRRHARVRPAPGGDRDRVRPYAAGSHL